MRLTVSISALLAGLACAGCVNVSETRTPGTMSRCQVGEPMVETMLFFGMSKPGGAVSRFEFSQFVESEVVPRWKEGFTVVDADGFWFAVDRSLTQHEDSRILLRVHGGSPADSAGIDAIRDAYRKSFQQEAVLRTDTTICADF